MKKWGNIKLGEIADFSNGINFDKTAYTKGVRLIGVSNFGNRFFPPYEELDEVKREIVRKNDYLQKDDIVFVRSNGNKELVGRCMIIDDISVPLTYSGFCIRCRIKNKQDYNPIFFTYYFKSKLFRMAMSGTAVGANIQNLSQARLSSHVLRIPNYKTQCKIAEVLFNYEKYIENAQRQIRLLDEAAQRLYKEWFVNLRFPDHEIAQIENGVPFGWHRGLLGEIVEFRRGKTITKAQVCEGNVPVVAGGLEPAYYHNVANTKAPVITVSGSGANAGFSKMYHEDVFASDCSFADIHGTKSLSFIYCFLKSNKYQLDALQKGSAQPHVYAKDINSMELLIPSPDVLTRYCNIADVMFNKIGVLHKQIISASEAQNRLLQKLMSEEIEL